MGADILEHANPSMAADDARRKMSRRKKEMRELDP